MLPHAKGNKIEGEVPLDLLEEGLTVWELQQSATALQEAEKLIQNRELYFEQLYDDIRYFAVRYEDAPTLGSNPSVEYQALTIIDSKRAYNRRIEKLKEKFIRWRGFLRGFSKSDADLLRRYFEEGDPIPHDTIKRLLSKAERKLTASEEARGKSLDAEAREQYKEYRKKHPGLDKGKNPTSNVHRKHYMVDGRFIYMSEKEHADHIQQEQDRQGERRRLFEGSIYGLQGANES